MKKMNPVVHFEMPAYSVAMRKKQRHHNDAFVHVGPEGIEPSTP